MENQTQNNFTFFWGGPFSNWCPAEFEIDGMIFSCSEQYMMYKKAELFNDQESIELIMGTRNPSDQKDYGRKVKNFDKDLWENNCKKFVYDACYAKFDQNPDLLKEMFATGDSEFVEASPEDRIWGIGLFEGDPDCLDKSKWRGTNWLGEILTQVREDLKIKHGII